MVDPRRAESFGTCAAEYDRHRPRYPSELVAGLVDRDGIRVLDVGAGTGIASAQLLETGADVTAVEPDPRMANIAADKGIRVEVATFEDWQPDGRSFDLVVFAQSFHWVQPRLALDKVARILSAGGRLVLLSNRITPTAPTRSDLEEVYADYLPASKRPDVDAVHNDELMVTIKESGFTVERRSCVEWLHYSTNDWLDLVFTYSSHLMLDPAARKQLRSRLEDRIGETGVHARNDATAVVCVAARAGA